MKNSLCILFLLLGSSIAYSQTLNLSVTKDAWLWSHPTAGHINFGKANSQNSGLNNVIRAESWQWIPNRDDSIRSILNFDLDTLQAQVSNIQKATLVLQHFSNPNFTKQVGNNAFEIFVVTENWKEDSVTWFNKPLYDTTMVSKSLGSSSDTESFQIDVTALVQHYLQIQGEGFYIKLQQEQPFSGLSFASREHTNTNLHPHLIVELTKPLSLNENVEKPHFNNPFDESIRIETNTSESILVALTDAKGILIFKEEIREHHTFNTSTLSKGWYFLSIGDQKYKLLK